jgi:hypothetical protein
MVLVAKFFMAHSKMDKYGRLLNNQAIKSLKKEEKLVADDSDQFFTDEE